MRTEHTVMTARHVETIRFLSVTYDAHELRRLADVKELATLNPRYGSANRGEFAAQATSYRAAAILRDASA